MSFTVRSPNLSPSLDEYSNATLTDENGNVLPAVAVLPVDSSGHTGSAPYTINKAFVSNVTDRMNPPLAHTADGKLIPLVALVSLDNSSNLIPLTVPESSVANLISDLAGKQPVGNYITALTGEVSATGPGAVVATLSNPAVISKVLTGYAPSTGALSASDSILSGIQKVDGNSKLAIKTRRATAISTTLAATDYLIAVTDTTALRTITLPLASTIVLPSGAIQEFIIKDESGGANTNNITVAATGPNTIDGAASVAISANYGISKIYTNGVNWFTR